MQSNFTDIDYSEINGPHSGNRSTFEYFTVLPPAKSAQSGREEIAVYYFSRPENSDEILLELLTAMICQDGSNKREFITIGFDTEIGADGNIQLIQLCTGFFCILIHRRSGLFNSIHLKKLFLNELSTVKVIFAGAELATADALDMLKLGIPIVGLLDLTPVLSQDHGDNFSRPRLLQFHLNDNELFSMSLKTMYRKAFKIDWHKDKEVSCSNWGVESLSLVQIKYAALDAWTSCFLGDFTIQKFHHLGIYNMIFTTLPHSLCIRTANGDLLIKQIITQARELEKLGAKDPTAVKIQNMRINQKRPQDSIDVISWVYGHHIRPESKIHIRIYAPGQTNFISILAKSAKANGKKGTVELEANWHDFVEKSFFPPHLLRDILFHPVQTIVKHWRIEDDRLGLFSKAESRHDKLYDASLKLVRVRLFVVPEPDKLLRQVRWTVSDFVRGHFVSPDFFSLSLRKLLAVYNATVLHSGSISKTKTIFSSGWNILSGLAFNNNAAVALNEDQIDSIELHAENLNVHQALALRNAFNYKISVIKGPPGTGKTRTIASIADVAQTGELRMLVIAPGNSASRRILESLVKTGNEDACLLVAESFFYEWHEEAYGQQSLDQYVHTKSTFVDARDSRAAANDGKSASREARDFRKRLKAEHVSKWLQVANGTNKEPKSKPSVIIGTYGSIALNGVGENRKNNKKTEATKWGEQVKNILSANTIDILVIDETSQLWSAYGLSILARLPMLKHIVLVGDEDQLAPFGVTEVPFLQSLFDAAIIHQSIPCTILCTTYRLSAPMADLLSTVIYKNKLKCERPLGDDTKFINKIKVLLFRTQQYPQSVRNQYGSFDMKFLLTRLCNQPLLAFRSLAWIHHSSPPHKNRESKSLGNELEASVIVSCCAQLLLMIYNSSVSMSQSSTPESHEEPIKVVIITGYLEQKDIIERQLGKCLTDLKFREGDSWGNVEVIEWVKSSLIVNTVDSFQGQEADVVFVSTVRSLSGTNEFSGLGFAKDQRRSCVMLSRASQLLVVVGDAVNATLAKDAQHLLLPRLSNYCSDNNSLFEIVESKLIPFEISTSAIKVQLLTSRLSQRTPIKSTLEIVQIQPQQRAAQRTVQLSTLEYIKLHHFSKRVVDTLLNQPMFKLSLSEFTNYIPRSERGEYKSLILPVKKIPFVNLHQNHTEWIASLCCTNETALEIRRTNEFASDILEMMERQNGTVLMSDISLKYPQSIRPLSRSLSKLLKLTLGSKVVINHAFVKLSSDPNPEVRFAKAVENAIMSHGGRIKLDKLGTLVPVAVRPQHKKKKGGLWFQVQTALGSRVSLHEKYVVMNSGNESHDLTDTSLASILNKMSMLHLSKGNIM